MSRKQQRKKPKKKVARQAAAKQPSVQSGASSRTVNILLGCLVVLVLGLAIRFALVRIEQSELANLEASVSAAETKGDWPEMELAARAWAEKAPLQFGPWDAASRAAMQLGQPDLAAEYLARMPNDAPVEAYHTLGQLQAETLLLPFDAEETLLRTLKQYPEDTESHLRLMFLYTMTCQRNKAVAEAERAIGVGSDISGTYAYLFAAPWVTYTNGYAMCQSWLQYSPDSEALHVASAIHLLSHPQLQSMALESGLSDSPSEFYEAVIQKLRERYPQNTELLAAELDALCKAGDTEEVAKRLTSAPESTKTDSRFWRAKGWYNAATDDIPAATEAFETALDLQPLDWQTRQQLAQILRQSGQTEQTAEQLELATLGKTLADGIRNSSRIDQLKPESLLSDLATFFSKVGLTEHADKLSSLLR